jgi:CubicO group peptidase (beta-lactamase class C family)
MHLSQTQVKIRCSLLALIFVLAAACNFSLPVSTAAQSPAAPTLLASPLVKSSETAAPLPTERLATAVPASVPTQPPSLTPQAAWEWRHSSPEEQGLSSTVLADMLEAIAREKQNIHSVVVIRHGVVVLEAYRHPFNGETRHELYSVSKSVTSALVGIANGQGLLKGVEQPVSSYFPGLELDDPNKGTIRVEHLLSMTSGIEWAEPLYSGLNDHWGILEADDPARYFFSPALVETPGKVFNYNSGGSHMLSLLVQQAVGRPAAQYAAEKLFAPLQIEDYSWESDFTGHTKGGAGLALKSLDAAKIGQLYLQGGQWLGQSIVPDAWVKQSSAIHSTPSEGMGYGYQWWVRPAGDYYALGWGGQQIRVFPKQDMVVVFTAGMSGAGILHADLVDKYLLPAVKSETPLAADPQAGDRLEQALQTLSDPQIWPSKPLAPLASMISGKQWLVTGQGNWSMFTLRFSGLKEAELELTLKNDPMPLRVGLDGRYRVVDTVELGPVALVGYWDTPDTFVLIQQNLREADRRTTRLQFLGKQVKLKSEWIVEPHQEESEAELFGQ